MSTLLYECKNCGYEEFMSAKDGRICPKCKGGPYIAISDILPNDNVNHPNHYADKQIEVIDYIRDTITPEQFTGYCIGNVIKYISRYRKKNGKEDLKKAQVYLGWAIQHYDHET